MVTPTSEASEPDPSVTLGDETAQRQINGSRQIRVLLQARGRPSSSLVFVASFTQILGCCPEPRQINRFADGSAEVKLRPSHLRC